MYGKITVQLKSHRESEIVRVTSLLCSASLGNVQFELFLVGDCHSLHRSSTRIRQHCFQQIRSPRLNEVAEEANPVSALLQYSYSATFFFF